MNPKSLIVLALATLATMASAELPAGSIDELQEQVIALQREKTALQREKAAWSAWLTKSLRSQGVCYWSNGDCLRERDTLNVYFGMASTPELSINANCQIEQQALGSVCAGMNYILRSYVKITPQPAAAKSKK